MQMKRLASSECPPIARIRAARVRSSPNSRSPRVIEAWISSKFGRNYLSVPDEEIFKTASTCLRDAYAVRVSRAERRRENEWALVQRGKETVNDRDVIQRMSRGSQEDARKRSLPRRGCAQIITVTKGRVGERRNETKHPLQASEANNARAAFAFRSSLFFFFSGAESPEHVGGFSISDFCRSTRRERREHVELQRSSDRSAEGKAAASCGSALIIKR